MDSKDKKLKSFGLDRMRFIEVLKAGFKEKYLVDVKEHFKNSFGIISLEPEDPKIVIIECTNQQAEYIKSFPLHETQQIISQESEKTIFELYLHPTYDFMQEILSYGKEVKVIEPQCLIEKIRHHLEESLKHYV